MSHKGLPLASPHSAPPLSVATAHARSAIRLHRWCEVARAVLLAASNPQAGAERLIFGLGIRAGRLYYAVAAGLRIWSVGLRPDGSFGNDATIEVEVPPGAAPSEISKITFDERGRMFLAERPEPTGAYDFEALTQEGVGRVLRYEIAANYPGAPRV